MPALREVISVLTGVLFLDEPPEAQAIRPAQSPLDHQRPLTEPLKRAHFVAAGVFDDEDSLSLAQGTDGLSGQP